MDSKEKTKLTIENNQKVLTKHYVFSHCVFSNLESPGVVMPSRAIFINPDPSIDDSATAAYTKAGNPPKQPKDYLFNIWNLAVIPIFKNDSSNPDFSMALLYDRKKASLSTSIFNPTVDLFETEAIMFHRHNEEMLTKTFNKSFDELKAMLGMDKNHQFQECFMQGYNILSRVNARLYPHLIFFDTDGNGNSITKFKRNMNLNKVYEDIPTWYDLNNSKLDRTLYDALSYPASQAYLFKKPMYYNLYQEKQWPAISTASAVADAVSELGTTDENNEVSFEDFDAMKDQIKGELENQMIFRSQF